MRRFASGIGSPNGAEARVRYEADGCEDFVRVVLRDILSQGSVEFLNVGRVPVCLELGGCLRCFGEENDAGGGSAQTVDGICVGNMLLDQAEESVFHESAAGKGGQTAGFVDDQQVRIVEQGFKALRSIWLDPRGTVPDNRLACRKRFASGGGDAVESDFAIVQFLLPSLLG